MTFSRLDDDALLLLQTLLLFQRNRMNTEALRVCLPNSLDAHGQPDGTVPVDVSEKKIVTSVECSDIFLYATADTENITRDSTAVFLQALQDMKETEKFAPLFQPPQTGKTKPVGVTDNLWARPTPFPPPKETYHTFSEFVTILYAARMRGLKPLNPKYLGDDTINLFIHTPLPQPSSSSTMRMPDISGLRCCGRDSHKKKPHGPPGSVEKTLKTGIDLLRQIDEAWGGPSWRVNRHGQVVFTINVEYFGYHFPDLKTDRWEIPFCEADTFFDYVTHGYSLLSEREFPDASGTTLAVAIKNMAGAEKDMQCFTFDEYVSAQLSEEEAEKIFASTPQMLPHLKNLKIAPARSVTPGGLPRPRTDKVKPQ